MELVFKIVDSLLGWKEQGTFEAEEGAAAEAQRTRRMAVSKEGSSERQGRERAIRDDAEKPTRRGREGEHA